MKYQAIISFLFFMQSLENKLMFQDTSFGTNWADKVSLVFFHCNTKMDYRIYNDFIKTKDSCQYIAPKKEHNFSPIVN